MPEPMKFCASMTKCSKAYTVGKPGRVKIAADRDPLSEDKLNKLVAFLADKLSPDDFEKFQDLIDDVVDDAEEANPSAQMAEDGYSKSTRRTIRRAHRNIALGLTGASSMAQDSARTKSFEDRYPGAARIRSDLTWGGQPAERSPTPRVAMDSKRVESFNERFGTGRIRDAS